MNTCRSQTARRIFTTLLALGSLLAAHAGANDAIHIDRQQSKLKGTKSSARKAQIMRGMDPDDSFALKFAYKGAIKKLEKDAACRALFDNLVVDGIEALGRSRYQPALSGSEKRHCAAGVAAYTAIGSVRVVICGQFHRLDRHTKSAVLIHEALHTAGLSEAPVDPNAMTAAEIEEMVEEACGLSL
jgi:hypothetical protein